MSLVKSSPWFFAHHGLSLEFWRTLHCIFLMGPFQVMIIFLLSCIALLGFFLVEIAKSSTSFSSLNLTNLHFLTCLGYAPKHMKNIVKNAVVFKSTSEVYKRFFFSCVTIYGYFWAEIVKSNTTFHSPVLSKLHFLFCSEVLFMDLNM